MSVSEGIVLQKSFCRRCEISGGRWRVIRVKFEGPHRLALNSWATSVARLRLCESATSLRFRFSPKIWTAASFDFCNTIEGEADLHVTRVEV